MNQQPTTPHTAQEATQEPDTSRRKRHHPTNTNHDKPTEDEGASPPVPLAVRSTRSIDDPLTLAKAARIVRTALARRAVLSEPEPADGHTPEDSAKTP